MSRAVLELRNIGGLKGNTRFEFERGRVNEVESANAMGKTSLIRGLAAVLSAPLSHDELIAEAANQGVLRDSLKNIYEKDAASYLRYDGEVQELELRADGSFAKLPQGDERFLLGGLLTPEAKIIRQLLGGDTDFSWVTQRLSFARRYAEAKMIADSELLTAERNLEQLSGRQEALLEQDKIIEAKKAERKELNRQRDELAQRLDEKKREHVERIKRLDGEIETQEQRLGEYQAVARRAQREVTRIEERLASNAEKGEQLANQIGKIDVERIRQEVIANVKRIDDDIAARRSEAAVLAGKRSAFADAKSVLAQRGETSGLCPVCETSTVSVGFLDDKLSQLGAELRQIESAIRDLSGERTRWLQREASASRQIDGLRQELKRLQDDNKELNTRKLQEQRNVQSATKALEQASTRQQELEGERTALQQQTGEWAAEIHDALQKIEARLKGVGDEIATHARRIQEASIVEVYGERVTFEEGRLRLGRWMNKLNGVSEYLDERRHDHEVRAIAEFNAGVKKVMADLGFTEFDQIAIDKQDNRLKVFRPGFVPQPLESLSTSERYSIAIALQIALKNTYLPEVPFFIVDEVVVSYDEERKEKILDYLGKMADDNNLYVVVTRLSPTAGAELSVRAR